MFIKTLLESFAFLLKKAKKIISRKVNKTLDLYNQPTVTYELITESFFFFFSPYRSSGGERSWYVVKKWFFILILSAAYASSWQKVNFFAVDNGI